MRENGSNNSISLTNISDLTEGTSNTGKTDPVNSLKNVVSLSQGFHSERSEEKGTDK